jgi:putative DNA primase/helicase
LDEKTAARSWVALRKAGCAFDHTKKAWFIYGGSHWEEDKVRLAFHDLGEHCNQLQAGKKGMSAGFVRGAEAFAQADPRAAVDHSKWDRDEFLVGTPGKTIDCRTGKLLDPNPAHFISKRTSVAPAEGEPTRWLQFLEEATGGDAELIRYLQQILGYTLTGSTKEHALFFIFGPGKNGKSVFLNTASRILGDYSKVAAMATFTASKNDRHSTELAMLDGARMVSASETEEGRSWAEATIKQLTGGDPITARFMRQDNFTFTPRFKLIIVGNHQPQLHSVDEATRRRFNIVEFKHTPPRPDKDLEEKLAAEHGRILSWMIRGCLDWQKHGLVRPESVVRATDEYFDAQDMLGQWLGERCVTGPNCFDQPTVLYRDWCEFSKANGEDPGTSRSFFMSLPKRGFPKGKLGGLRGYRGLSVRPSAA